MQKEPQTVIGESPLRKEGAAKVLGSAQYVDDLSLPGMWFGVTIRSTIARGRIRSIAYDPAIDWTSFTIVTAADIPGENTIVHLGKDHPCLADGRVNHVAEPILLIAHADRSALLRAAAAIHIDYEELPGIFTIEESERAAEDNARNPGHTDGVVWNNEHGTSPNTFKHYLLQKDRRPIPDHVWAQADFIVEGEYTTGAQEQLYIENNGVIAECNFDSGGVPEFVTVRGSMQCPFYIVHALSLVFNLPAEHCRVIQTETGGAFGGKEDFPSVIGSHAALLAMKSGRPVKLTYDRAEDMAATTKRHPSRTRHRTAVSREGTLLAGEIDFAIDGGAYATLSPVVLSRGTIHAAGPYNWPHLEIRAKAMATNIPPHGAFRGFGAPQSIFALERHLDKIAGVVGLTPEELRRRNFLHTGDRTATGQFLIDPVDMDGLLTQALADSDFHRKQQIFAAENPASLIKRGMGLATFFHGAGFTGSGERRLNSVVDMALTPTGHPEIFVSSTEFGQGTNTILCQVAAETLRLPYEWIQIAQPDTSRVPNSGPTVASRTAMIVGKLVEQASGMLSAALVSSGKLAALYSADDFAAAGRAYLAEHGDLRVSARYQLPPGSPAIFWDDDTYSGDAYPAYAWAVYVAEVEVDTRTWTASVTSFHAVQEVGRVLHPVLAKGQVEGGVAQGIGYALYEKCVYADGHLRNNQMTNYIMPTSMDLPAIQVSFAEVACSHGAFGAKGIGELPMDGPAPAILNAIESATGHAFTAIPLLPEDIFEALSAPGDHTAGAEHLEPAVAGPYFSELPR